MFICEAVVFICSILVVVWDMASNEGMEGYNDMHMYTVLCSISTFCALLQTLSLLLIPTHVRRSTTDAISLHPSSAQKQCNAAQVSVLKLIHWLVSVKQR
jgi:hypothetical protein